MITFKYMKEYYRKFQIDELKLRLDLIKKAGSSDAVMAIVISSLSSFLAIFTSIYSNYYDVNMNLMKIIGLKNSSEINDIAKSISNNRDFFVNNMSKILAYALIILIIYIYIKLVTWIFNLIRTSAILSVIHEKINEK